MIVQQVCLTENRLEVRERITWLQKAEGCLIKMDTPSDAPKDKVAQLLKFKDYYLVILQLCNSLKGDDEALKRLKTEVMSPNDLCLIALQAQQWEAFLTIIEINELRRYHSQGYTLKPKLEDPKATQERINFLYTHLLQTVYPPEQLKTPAALADLMKLLRALHARGKAFAERAKVECSSDYVELFPAWLVFDLIET